jgi:hypothetical protein
MIILIATLVTKGNGMTSPSRPLRFGLIGTGYWARVTHAPALAATEGIELTAIWGRDPEATADLAAAYGATPHDDEAAFLAGADAAAFSVPPAVQALFAARAARRVGTCCSRSPSRWPTRRPTIWSTRWMRLGSPPWSSSPTGSTPTGGRGWPTSPPAADGPGAWRSGWAPP